MRFSFKIKSLVHRLVCGAAQVLFGQSCAPFRLCKIVTIVTILGSVSGCSRRYHELPAYWPFTFEERENQSVGRFKTSFIAEQIDHYYRGTDPGAIGIATFANLDDLYKTSSFGRVYSEQLLSELSMRGYDVIELRHADSLQFLNTEGEFMLSREPGQVRAVQHLQGVVVGTYSVSPVRVYINARLIDPKTSMILAAGSVEMEKTEEIERMLKRGGVASQLERVPVSHWQLQKVPHGQGFLFPPTNPPHASPAPRSKRASGGGFKNPEIGAITPPADRQH